MEVDLSKFNNDWYKPGRGVAIRTLWYFINALFFINPLNTSSGIKVFLLRLFGAKIGQCVVLKPSINIKYPWLLEIGDNSWIGEGAWLDNLAQISIRKNCCISQGAYLCTGNHDWSDEAFCLVVKPICVEDGAWIGAKAMVLPGVIVKTHAIISAGSVMSSDAEPYTIYCGHPAVAINTRDVKESSTST